MGRIKHVVVFLLLLVSCKQYDEVSDKVENGLEDKSVSEISKEEVKKTPEEALREKLNEKQKASLDFLKEALNDDGKLNNLLGLEEGKVKGVLEHIQTELAKCTGDSASGKGTFKSFFGSGWY